ncbi:hypothetical protein CLV48_11513 [Cecembia rubra]|uniref:6-bladed beta-propeller protein n=2 Tax=Cecembia rubra TaxID=1485585 RepID=A0A2P8DTC6_9BACT|nr:hypothetical protein CLV48_11513 [Cecembia rubra]
MLFLRVQLKEGARFPAKSLVFNAGFISLAKSLIMKTSSFPVLIILMLIFACSEKNKLQSVHPNDIQFFKVDSVQIPYLGLLNLMDVHLPSGQLLFFNQQTGHLVLGSMRGELIREFSKQGDMPDSYGFFPLGAGKFSSNGKAFTIISNQGVYTYDLEGNLVHGGRHRITKLPAFSGRASSDMEFFWVGDRILTVGAGRGEYPRNTPEFYENYQSLAWFDTLERKVEQFMKLDEKSVFRNGMAHDISHLTPRMALAKDKIYLVQGIEPALNMHSLTAPYEKIKRVDFDISDYIFNQGEEFKKADPRIINPDMFSGRIENLKVTDQYVLVSFFPGIPEREQEKYQNLGWMDFLDKTRKDYNPRMLVMDLDGNLLTELEIPLQFSERQWLYRDGYLWFLASLNLKEEEDFVKVYKVKLGG